MSYGCPIYATSFLTVSDGFPENYDQTSSDYFSWVGLPKKSPFITCVSLRCLKKVPLLTVSN